MNLAEAAGLLWSADCGALPVVDCGGRVIGIVTDRDFCIAVGTRNTKPSEIQVSQVMTSKVLVAHPDDEIHEALQTMRSHKVRRLPVVSGAGRLIGMLSLSECLLHARPEASRDSLSYQDLISTLRGIYVHCPPHCGCG